MGCFIVIKGWLYFMFSVYSADYVKAFEANINNLAKYREIHLDTSVDYYCVQLEGFEIKGNPHTSNGYTLYGGYLLNAEDGYILQRDECAVVGPAGEVCLMTRNMLCDLFVRPDGRYIDNSLMRREYDWFRLHINPKYIGSLNVLAVPPGYILNTMGLKTDGGYDKRGHGSCDYIVCANSSLAQRYIVNGVVLGLESVEGREMQPKVKPYIKGIEDIKRKIELG